MIDNEKDLDRVFAKEMRKLGASVYKIESHLFNGLPDFYCSIDDKLMSGVLWIENKIVENERQEIKYRPGQQKFLLDNFIEDIVETYTLVYNKNNKCFYIIYGTQCWNVTRVPDEYAAEFRTIKEVVKWLLNC